MFAIQWENTQTGEWEVCQTFDDEEDEIACVFFDEGMALSKLVQWEEDYGSNYRVAPISILNK